MRAKLTRLRCWARGHDWMLVQIFTPRTRKLKCKRCQKYFGMNDDVRALIEWDSDLEAFHCMALGIERTNL